MTSSGLIGSYPLTNEKIDSVVSEKIGAYALGKLKDGTFYISYVGRSDTNLNDRLHKHVGDYTDFKYRHYPTKKEAFEKECTLYHDFTPGDNKYHPDKPNGTNYSCPVSGCNY